MGVGCCGCYNFRTLSAVVAHAFLPRILYCKSKAGRKNLSLYTGSLARTNFSQAVLRLQIATLAFQHLLLSESLLVSSALLRVYLCRFLRAMYGHNVLYNVATTLLSSFVIPDLLCDLSQLNLCDIIYIPDTQPPSAPALVIFNSSGLCRQIVRKGQWRRALKSSEPLFFVYFRLDYYECVLFFVKNVDFSNYRNFYTHIN